MRLPDVDDEERDLVARDGRVAFQGEVGPFGFRPEELAAAIDEELGYSNA